MIVGIGHVAFNVNNLDAVLDFYTNKLGFAEMFHLNNQEGQLWIIYLRINDSVYLELFPFAAPPQPIPPKTAGFNHLCLEVKDIEGTVEALRAKGVEITQEIKLGLDGNKQAWIRDPEGTRIELMELMPGSMQAQAIERLRASSAQR